MIMDNFIKRTLLSVLFCVALPLYLKGWTHSDEIPFLFVALLELPLMAWCVIVLAKIYED